MTGKDILEHTDEYMLAQIKTGTVKHRRCDVCGCELAIPDLGVFSRGALTTMACTTCSNTKAHHVLLSYIEDLKKTHNKAGVHQILDERMKETWDESGIFTVEEWEEQTKEQRCLFCNCNIMEKFGTPGIIIKNIKTNIESEICYGCYDRYDKKQYKIICCENCQLFRWSKCETKDVNGFCDHPERYDDALNEWRKQEEMRKNVERKD